MPSLHDLGWRQGTIFAAPLVAVSYGYDDGHVVPIEDTFERWVVVSQDCDLHAQSSDSHDRVIEIAPVATGNPGTGWGIRSRRLRLSADAFVEAASPRLKVSAQALCVYAYAMEPPLAEGRATALKTWLGLRFDRPAVPTELVPLARAIAAAVKATRSPELASACHDVLFQVGLGDPPQYELTAVVVDDAPVEPVEDWLAAAAMQIGVDLGIMASPPAALSKSQLSVELLENSYSADLSDITWKKMEPTGAR